MAGDREPDWSYEEAKARAAISRNAVMSDEEKAAAYRGVGEEWADNKARWRQEQQRLADRGQENKSAVEMYSGVTDKAELAQALARNQKEKFDAIKDGEERMRAECLHEETQHSSIQDQAETDRAAMSEALGQINKEKHEDIAKAEQALRDDYAAEMVRAQSSKKDVPLESNLTTEAKGSVGEEKIDAFIRVVPDDSEKPKRSNQFTERLDVENHQSQETGHKAEEPQFRSTVGHTRIKRVLVLPSGVQSELPQVATPLKYAVKSALFQIEQYRKDISQNNYLCGQHPEFLEQLLQMLDGLNERLTEVYSAIPENTDSVSLEDARKVAVSMECLKNEGSIEIESYFGPESLVKDMIPTGIILAFGAVGSFFGPLGYVAGGVIGSLVVKNTK